MDKEVVEDRKYFAIVDEEISEAELCEPEESYMKKLGSKLEKFFKELNWKFFRDSDKK